MMTSKLQLLFCAVLIKTVTATQIAQPPGNSLMKLNDYKVIDLTHSLNSSVPTWDGNCGYSATIIFDYDGKSVTQFQGHSLHLAKAGTGTHMDAPRHCFKDLASIADIAPEKFLLPAFVIDVSRKADADYEIASDDILEFEKQFGQIPENSIVIAYTGWSRFWTNPLQYRNADSNGIMHFPAFSKKAIELLIKRNVQAIGIDTLSPDIPTDTNFPVHNLILSRGKYILENLANCDKLPATGSFIIALPLKIEGGSEAPARVIAFIE